MRLGFASAALLVLAACDGGTVPASPDGPIRSEETVPNATAPGSPAEEGQSTEADPGLRFVGDWAANAGACETAAWKFTDTMVSTPAGSTCSFNKVEEVAEGYDIEATCTAEAPPTSDMLKVRLAEEAGSMVFESETIADASLVSCGDDG